MVSNWNRGINGVRFPDVCKDCKPPKRSSTCHGTCQEYKDAKAEFEVEANKEREARKAVSDSVGVTFLLKKN